MKSKLLVILGPTATGKSALAVLIAKKFNGEVVSADSRQVYKGLDLGTGKITEHEMRGVPHYLLNVANPLDVFNVEKFKKLALQKIAEILKRQKLPIMCGGTGFYIQSVIDNISFPQVPPNQKLREQLAKKSAKDLFIQLQKLDLRRSSEVDPHNRVRLIRAIEIAKKLGKVPEINKHSPFDTLQIGIDLPDKILKRTIAKRLNMRIKKGMIAEVENLHKNGLSWKRMEELGLEYRFISKYLRKLISLNEMKGLIMIESWHYAKRQRTWFRKDKRIKRFSPNEETSIKIEISKFLK